MFYSRKESASLAKPSWPMLSSVPGNTGLCRGERLSVGSIY